MATRQFSVRNTLAEHTHVDRRSISLAILLIVVQVGAVLFATSITGSAAEPSLPNEAGETTAGQAASAATWVGLEVVLAVGMVALYFVYRRLPEWLQEQVSDTVEAALFLGVGLLLAPDAWALAGILLLFYFSLGVLGELNLFWIINNLFVIGLAIVTAALIGLLFGVVGVLVALTGMTLYDHYFANKHDWMFDLAELLSVLPIIYYMPGTWRFDMDDVFGTDDAGLPEVSPEPMAIGMADLGLPCALPVAVVVATGGLGGSTLLVLGAIALGLVLAAFRLRHELLSRGSGAGLPALSAGVIGAYALGTLGTTAIQHLT